MSNLDHYQEIHLLVSYCKNIVNIYDILMVQTFFSNLLVQRLFFLIRCKYLPKFEGSLDCANSKFSEKKSLSCL